MSIDRTRIPIMTIGGFLGAGKTTLINRLLSDNDGERTIVFVNDFGTINIDHTLIETVEADKISLKNGCVCCTLNQDLISQIMDFASLEPKPDRFVIEASGVADPRSLETSIDTLEQAGVVLADANIYLIDVENFQDLSFDESETVIDCAAASDLVILSKVDKAQMAHKNILTNTLSVSAPYSLVVESVYGDIGLPLRALVNELGKPLPTPMIVGSEPKSHGLFAQTSLIAKSSIDRTRFDNFLRELPKACWRAKGLLRFSDAPHQVWEFHLVGRRASLEQTNIEVPSLESQFVAIGRADQMCPEKVKADFQATLCG